VEGVGAYIYFLMDPRLRAVIAIGYSSRLISRRSFGLLAEFLIFHVGGFDVDRDGLARVFVEAGAATGGI
jgi:hypothetical protein